MVKSLQNKTRKRRRTRKQVGSGNFSSRVSSERQPNVKEDTQKALAILKHGNGLSLPKENRKRHYKDADEIQTTLAFFKQGIGLPLPEENRRRPTRRSSTRRTSGKSSMV